MSKTRWISIRCSSYSAKVLLGTALVWLVAFLTILFRFKRPVAFALVVSCFYAASGFALLSVYNRISRRNSWIFPLVGVPIFASTAAREASLLEALRGAVTDVALAVLVTGIIAIYVRLGSK
jgi:hypothetical protein